MSRAVDPSEIRSPQYRALLCLSLFYLVFLVGYKMPLLRLPYYGDAIGYYVPLAKQMQANGFYPIPRSREIVDAGHPPLLGFLLASVWGITGSRPFATHLFMQLISLATVLFTYLVGQQLDSDGFVGLGASLMLAVSPVFFFGSSLPQADTLAAALTILCVYLTLRGSFFGLAVWGSLLVLAKETAVLFIPVAVIWAAFFSGSAKIFPSRKSWRAIGLSASIPFLTLGFWFTFHKWETGYFQSNLTHFSRGVSETALLIQRLGDPVLLMRQFAIRVIQLAVTDFKWIGSLVIFAGIIKLAVCHPWGADGLPGSRQRVKRFWVEWRTGDRRVAWYSLLSLLILAYLVFLSAAGFLNPRYLLPVTPAFFLLVAGAARSLFASRLPFWGVVGLICIFSFVAHSQMSDRFGTPEDNAEYADIVRVNQQAARFLEERYGDRKILANYPGAFILKYPYLGYVRRPLDVWDVHTIDADSVHPGDYDVLFVPFDMSSLASQRVIGRLRPGLIRRFESNGKWAWVYDMRPQAPER